MNQIYNKLKSSYLLQCSTVHLHRGCRLQAIGSATVSPICHILYVIICYFPSSWEMKAQPWPWEYGLWKGLSSCLFPSLLISLPLLSAEYLQTNVSCWNDLLFPFCGPIASDWQSLFSLMVHCSILHCLQQPVFLPLLPP